MFMSQGSEPLGRILLLEGIGQSKARQEVKYEELYIKEEVSNRFGFSMRCIWQCHLRIASAGRWKLAKNSVGERGLDS